MSYSTPIPPLIPFSPSGRRPLSQPLSEENKTDIPAKNNYGSQTERSGSVGKHISILPPLISALDTYIESSVEAKADSIISQLNERHRPDSNNDDSSVAKKKRRKIKPSGKKTKTSTLHAAAKLVKALTSPTTDGTPSIYSTTDSLDSMNQTNDILNPGEYDYRSQYLSDSSKETDISLNPAASPRAILASKYLSSPSKHSSGFDIMNYTVAKKPTLPITSSSASKAINNRNIRVAALPEVCPVSTNRRILF